MENKKMYDLIGKMALEFRLSLDNVCRLLGKEPNDKTKLEIYEAITAPLWNFDDKNKYSYLFNYETINENSNASILAYTKATLFLKKYSEAIKENNRDDIKNLERELTKTEDEFRKLKNSGKITFTEEEITVISKYRLKHCISKTNMGYFLNVSRDVLFNAEKRITNPNLKEKIAKLGEFHRAMALNSHKKKSR